MSDATMTDSWTEGVSRPRRHLPHLLLLVAWMAVMALFSGNLGSEETMQRALTWMLRPFVSPGASVPFSPALIWTLRKLIHLFEYGLLAVLATRWLFAWKGAARPAIGWGALLLSIAYAIGDEWHQSLFLSRTASGWDVLIDSGGAIVGLILLFAREPARRGIPYRVVDLLGAGFGLLLSAPLLACSALLIRIMMGSPVLFRQERMGLEERPFMLLKFRTMNEGRDAHGNLLPAKYRITRVGRLLRSLSLDELPQLWNVLRGDMSLVGPRPLYTHYLPYYTERERLRHHVRPGLTGLAQVNGRNSLNWDERLELDVQYVERKSLALDLSLLWKTIGKVLKRSDVQDGAVQGSLAELRQAMAKQESEVP